MKPVPRVLRIHRGHTGSWNSFCRTRGSDCNWLTFIMRVISFVEFDGVEYQAIWAARTRVDNSSGSAAMVLAVRTAQEVNQAIIPRNAKLAEVESALNQLRGLGLGEPQLARLFNFKGQTSKLPQHVKELVSSLR